MLKGLELRALRRLPLCYVLSCEESSEYNQELVGEGDEDLARSISRLTHAGVCEMNIQRTSALKPHPAIKRWSGYMRQTQVMQNVRQTLRLA
jgi:hypothetical protein